MLACAVHVFSVVYTGNKLTAAVRISMCFQAVMPACMLGK